MNLDKPIGNPSYGLMFLRLALGAFFLFSGLAKIDDPGILIRQVKNTGMLPDQWATVYAILLPYLEILGGVLLVSGFWTTLGSVLITICVGSVMHIFGPGLGQVVSATGVFKPSGVVTKDLILLAASIAMMFTGPGAFSIDGFRKTN
ncbi:MAG: DoxX family protein [bacterium]|nr:DoxX family protein [bacterium]